MMRKRSVIPPPAELAGVMDAMYRFGAGVDHNEGDLLASAFADDAVVDFRPCGRAMGLNFPVLTGGETIIGFLRGNAGVQTTSHVITNGRAQVEGRAATLRALVDATHLPKSDPSRRCRMMNWYDVELVQDGDLWRIRRLVISNAWFAGDVQVLLGK